MSAARLRPLKAAAEGKPSAKCAIVVLIKPEAKCDLTMGRMKWG